MRQYDAVGNDELNDDDNDDDDDDEVSSRIIIFMQFLQSVIMSWQ